MSQYQEISKVVGLRLKAIRELRKMSQKEVAEKMHFAQQIVSQYEAGKRNISIGLLLKFCAVLQADLALFDPRREFVFELKSIDKSLTHLEYIELCTSEKTK